MKSDRENWWTKKGSEVEGVATIRNTRNLYELIRNTSPWKPNGNEMVKESNDILTPSQARRLGR